MGSRLYPVTLDDKPMIYYRLSSLVLSDDRDFS
jgi:dTDP-glucose pyrophosphorylase